jgi:hypothetical protein
MFLWRHRSCSRDRPQLWNAWASYQWRIDCRWWLHRYQRWVSHFVLLGGAEGWVECI